ncbi:putative 50S ribosomal protein L25 [Robiginitalea biformata HTCC2501]|uniref:50S ribosomal protein L25 n=1 Tax=Robiginitalea biformata (strain ATCC BAA-864 / DSM 15991 / KCTC 12146 / HTCC2501) TaxID=313596 RepID=A4CH13_ROBBH|nr:putative 50S ribosomal protein L25 [Robiginitalea biformata HTCC2501]
MYTPNAHTVVIEFEDGRKIDAVLQDIQFHPVTDNILHVDFYQLFPDKEVTMKIPVRLLGNSPGVRNGGRLLFRKRKLVIRALPKNLPDFFNVDISNLKIGDLVAVDTLKSDEFTILHPDTTVVVQVKTQRKAIVIETDEEDEEGLEGEEAAAAEGAEGEASEEPAAEAQE